MVSKILFLLNTTKGTKKKIKEGNMNYKKYLSGVLAAADGT